MSYYPLIMESRQEQQVTDVFLGYNHNLKIGDGEFYDMQNLTSEYFPLLANRAKRGIVSTLANPLCLLAKAKLAYIDGTSLFYGGTDITSYFTAKGLSISASLLPKTMISMGAYIIIFPDKLYINTENYTDCGSIDAEFSTVLDSDVEYTLCRIDGSAYATPTVSNTAPPDPISGALWIDTSGDLHVLKQYSAVTDVWIDIPTVYTKIAYTGIGQSFNKHDGVTITGCAATGVSDSVIAQIAALNGTKIIYDKGDDYIVVVGLLDSAYTQTAGQVKISRKMPDLDYVTEAENRLWGCKYGLVDGETVNEIYCCALGDFKNWRQYLGLSTDSYTASVGTDGEWTGAVTHLGYPIFFKENVLHKVYISSTGAHRIVDTACRGVQKGCNKSLVVVNETLYYKGRGCVCAYDGSLPVAISDRLGTINYYSAVAGAYNDKYYISMRDTGNTWHLFVYDSSKRLWHREDNTQALCFAKYGDELYYIDADTNELVAATGKDGTPEEAPTEWSATTGLIGYSVVEHKYISRFNIRMKLPVGSEADLHIQYDSDGVWHDSGHIVGTGTNTFMIPVRPRRCDHFQIRISGKGDIRIYSLAKIHEVGSDGG
jgi:hypothetical protein